MNIAKNMEAVLVVTIALISVTGLATAGARSHQNTVASQQAATAQQLSQSAVKAAAAPQAGMTVVTISSKRLTRAEIAAL